MSPSPNNTLAPTVISATAAAVTAGAHSSAVLPRATRPEQQTRSEQQTQSEPPKAASVQRKNTDSPGRPDLSCSAPSALGGSSPNGQSDSQRRSARDAASPALPSQTTTHLRARRPLPHLTLPPYQNPPHTHPILKALFFILLGLALFAIMLPLREVFGSEHSH